MNPMTSVLGAFGLLGVIKVILEVLFYISAIAVAFKSMQALNLYINKNSK